MTFLIGYENFFSRNHQGKNELPLGMLRKPSSKAAASEGPKGVPLRYVEALNEARTPLEGFFSILPKP